MAEESKKRFEEIMNKLFQAPSKSRPNNSTNAIPSYTSGVHGSSAKKCPNVSSALAIVNPKLRGNAIGELQTASGSVSVQAPACRPWDRDDLFRRLATFKSMTWFAKPQAVSAINCARRGWINVDMDTIACESCGARLLFSTPSAWTLQQVEKAALVFSLKLDSGHKLLCPWVDNICDEKLALFPPKPTAILVEDYKRRCSELLQLSTLPVVSSSAIGYMRSPELQQFLEGSSGLVNNEGAGPCNEPQSASSTSYYQAQKLISLCGWEPYSLPYIVDCKDEQGYSNKNVNFANQSGLASDGLKVIFSPCADGNKEADNDSLDYVGAVSKSNSVALVCRLCGAMVGLWTFSSVQRPMEFLRLVGYTEVDGKSESAQPEDVTYINLFSGNENHNGSTEGIRPSFAASTSSKEKPSNLSLTIAGGPPPEKQNYRAIISLPVIGHNLRVRFSTDSLVDENRDTSLAEASITKQGVNQNGEGNSKMGNPLKNMQVVAQDSTKDDKLVENVESSETIHSLIGSSDRSQVEASSGSSREGTITNGDDTATQNNAAAFVETVGDKQSDLHGDMQNDNPVEARMQPVNHDGFHRGGGKSLEQVPLDKYMEFDPIRQHRHFCPWIASTANSAPGWQQTLSALHSHKDLSYPLPAKASSSLIEVDDPVASIKKLFSSPPTKRIKHSHAG